MQSISEETKEKLIKEGYKVEPAFNGMFWALNSHNSSLTRGPILSENEAWEACERDYNWKLEK